MKLEWGFLTHSLLRIYQKISKPFWTGLPWITQLIPAWFHGLVPLSSLLPNGEPSNLGGFFYQNPAGHGMAWTLGALLGSRENASFSQGKISRVSGLRSDCIDFEALRFRALFLDWHFEGGKKKRRTKWLKSTWCFFGGEKVGGVFLFWTILSDWMLGDHLIPRCFFGTNLRADKLTKNLVPLLLLETFPPLATWKDNPTTW